MEREDQPTNPSSASTLLRDVSNFKTPKRSSRNPSFHSPHPQFFTASKQTPYSGSASLALRRRTSSVAPSSTVRSKTAQRRLKAFELEHSKSSRKVQIRKERSLKCLSKSLTVWLNFLFEDPESCGCTPLGGLNGRESGTVDVAGKGKRESWLANGVGIGLEWRSPKRQRDCSWRGDDFESISLPTSMFLPLQSSLRDVCSFDDLKQRMRVYLSLKNCKEIFKVMTQVTKNIDEGRLKMKAQCPLVTDVGMKEKAVRILMSYNPIWLRVGLYIIFGVDSLLPNGDVSSEHEVAFLKLIIEKQFFSHSGLAKAYAYNKLVDGLYRSGYFETLGNIILKRFLLLVLMLDRAKSQGSLPIEYGIDGIDGGSPLLFSLQSSIKSSRQMINDFLPTDAMHGEGNLIAHLVIVGYKVSYEQCPLIECDFKVTDLFQDLQDGVRLCRAIQILQHDPSILLKIVTPSDSYKKNLANCGAALQYLKQAGVPLHDDDGMVIVGEDVANGDKELTLSLLWNMFVHLQLPLLINKTILLREIYKIHQVDVELPNNGLSTHLEMLLTWVQVICKRYDIQVDSFTSLVDGKAMWCLLDYYFRKELHCSCSYEDAEEVKNKGSIVSSNDDTDAFQNFILSQKLMALLGNFPLVLQTSDILENNGACNDRSVSILLAFLSFQLVVKKNTDRLNFHKLLGCKCQSPDRKASFVERWSVSSKAASNQDEADELSSKGSQYFSNDGVTMTKFKAIQTWWQDMAERNCKSHKQPAASALPCPSNRKFWTDIQENAAMIIQSHHRRLSERRNYMKIKLAVSFLQIVILSWLKAKKTLAPKKLGTDRVQELSCESLKQSKVCGRYITFMVDRHNFVKLKRSTVHIQQAVRAWISRRRQLGGNKLACNISCPDSVSAAISIQRCICQCMVTCRHVHEVPQIQNASPICKCMDLNDIHVKAAVQIQLAWKKNVACKSLCNQNLAAIKIQCVFRGWLQQRNFINQKRAALKIQADFRCFMCWRAFRRHKIAIRSAIVIQSHMRGWTARRKVRRLRHLVISLQRHSRAWLKRKDHLCQQKAATKIQSAQRRLTSWQAYQSCRHAAVEIQRLIRGQITRKRILGASCTRAANHGDWIIGDSRKRFQSFELMVFIHSILKLQRWWKDVMLLNSRTKAAIIIQTHIRGWLVRQKAKTERHCVVIQSFWRGYTARKESTRQLSDLRNRVQESAMHVDDSRRIINRLLVALSELQGMRSVSCILHTCATLDMATEYSQRCCEELVAAGAIDNLLKLIGSVSQSKPDQEVLKHALSTLKNLARYPHLVEVLNDSCGSVETVFREFLRNKYEGFFVAAELLKRICVQQKGIAAVRKSPAHLKRLHKLVEDLSRKLKNEKRNARGVPSKGQTERRLKEASVLLNLMMTNS